MSVYVERHPTTAIDKAAQVRGIAPNFIHSMDSALLLETVRQGSALGIRDWALAHDSFGAHPNRGEALYEAPRRAARLIYGKDVLTRFYGQLHRAGLDVDPPPEHPKDLPAEFTMGALTDGVREA